jgi:putative phosphoribosyl transferase
MFDAACATQEVPVTAMTIVPSEAKKIPIEGGASIDADVAIPADARGLVLFAHGSGSSRHSPRNRYVARELNFLKFGTVLADLLTAEEESLDRDGSYRFDIAMLTHRVAGMIDWATLHYPALPIGLFGASTGAAAALDAAAARPVEVRAVVSRGGRPDLAVRLADVEAPTLLIVGGDDTAVLEMNRDALRQLVCPKDLEVIPGATHLFDEPGTLEAVALAAGNWFRDYLSAIVT